jgi:hypothetical protein
VRIDPLEFRNLPLEVHSLLRDIPLHDVSVVDLPGGGDGRTVADVDALLTPAELTDANGAVRALFRLRLILGDMFGWDASGGGERRESYIHRLPALLRDESQVTPGTARGLFTVVYQLERESLAEVRNATVHAFLCNALQPHAGGYRLYWAVYVKPVSWLTPVYMAVIEPFRRFIVYPAILRRIRQAWIEAY